MTPTRKVVGLEDLWLRTAAAPNYFEAAAACIGIISALILEF
jgi:hypothetical protein